jgi:drug/metabolite transporter (DMT)-like permease
VALAPAAATLVAYLVLGEVPSVPIAVAVVLITIGVALASRVPPARA